VGTMMQLKGTETRLGRDWSLDSGRRTAVGSSDGRAVGAAGFARSAVGAARFARSKVGAARFAGPRWAQRSSQSRSTVGCVATGFARVAAGSRGSRSALLLGRRRRRKRSRFLLGRGRRRWVARSRGAEGVANGGHERVVEEVKNDGHKRVKGGPQGWGGRRYGGQQQRLVGRSQVEGKVKSEDGSVRKKYRKLSVKRCCSVKMGF